MDGAGNRDDRVFADPDRSSATMFAPLGTLEAASGELRLDNYGRAKKNAEFVTTRMKDGNRLLVVLVHIADTIVGVFNFGEIVRGLFQSAYLGYYAFAPHAGWRAGRA